jgi:hypothetical protein
MNNDKVQNVSCKEPNSRRVNCYSKTPVKFSTSQMTSKRMPVAAQSKAWVCGRSCAGTASSIPASGMNVSCECCVLSGRGLRIGPIPRPEKSYRVFVCVTERAQTEQRSLTPTMSRKKESE